MDRLEIAADRRTPYVSLDPATSHLILKGESYPEDVTAFYGPVFDALTAHLNTNPDAITVEIQLAYFNSSSAKALMMIIEQVDAVSAGDTQARVVWHSDPDDELMQELGEEFRDDVEHAAFEIVQG